MTKWKILTIIGIVIAIILLIVNLVYVYNLSQNDASSETTTQQAHRVFTASFNKFSTGLWEEKSEFDVQKQQLQLDMCFTAKNASEFASDNDVSDLLLSLQNISLEGNLKDIIDKETIDDINLLSTSFSSAERLEQDKDLLDSINKRLDEILEEIK